MLKSHPPAPQNGTLFGNRVVAGIISSGEVISEQGGPLIQYCWCPHKKMAMGRHRERTPLKTETIIEQYMLKPRNAKDCWLTPEPRREAWSRFSLRALGRKQPGQHLYFRFLTPATLRIHFCF